MGVSDVPVAASSEVVWVSELSEVPAGAISLNSGRDIFGGECAGIGVTYADERQLSYRMLPGRCYVGSRSWRRSSSGCVGLFLGTFRHGWCVSCGSL